MERLTKKQVQQWFPVRKKEASKGQCGRIYILAGSRGMVGAGVLASLGAMRSGAGLVRFATVKSQQVVAAKRAPLEVTTESLPEGKDGKLSLKAMLLMTRSWVQFKPHVLAVGPGLGQSSAVRSLVKNLWKTAAFPLVLDADGLNALAGEKKLERRFPTIITPHPGELARWFGVSVSKIQKDREKFVRLAAHRIKGICVLKGAGTLVSDGEVVWKNPTGNAGLASGGTGDVLAGMIAAFWGQMPSQTRADAIKAACLGVYVHGLAGDLAAKVLTEPAMLASDVAQFIPQASKKILKEK